MNIEANKYPLIAQGSLEEVLNILLSLKDTYPRCRYGKIIVEGIPLIFVDLHSLFFELEQIFKKEIYKFYSNSKKPVIIDCGAHIGLTSIYFARLYPSARIYSFEADQDIFKVLEYNISYNKIKNIKIYNKAVWIHNRGVYFCQKGNDSGYISNKSSHALVPSLKLKEFLDNFDKIDLLKLDIEGAEFEVLKDIDDSIDKISTAIVEVHKLNEKKTLLSDIFKVFERGDFRYVLSDCHLATWVRHNKTPFKFVNTDKYIFTIFAWNNKSYNTEPVKKIVQFCMQDYGGAGTAALRLHEGLLSIGEDSKLFLNNLKKWKECSFPLYDKPVKQRTHFISPGWQFFSNHIKKIIEPYKRRSDYLEIFTDLCSTNQISNILEVKEADILHFHWIAGTVNLAKEVDFLKTKKIVWTLHDMNPFTGGCHYSNGCEKYKEMCGKCPLLGSDREQDISRKIWEQKREIYKQLDITVVAPSKWLAECAKNSSLFKNYPVHIIPYGLPLDTFKPYDKNKLRNLVNIKRNDFVVLFGADSISNKRKGIKFLLDTLVHLKALQKKESIVLAVFGRNTEVVSQLGFPVISFGYVEDESQLAQIYSLADVTIVPSLEDNLPNIVLESLACGTPVVGFEVGGIPDMIKHKYNGFLAPPKSSEGLLEGILWAIAQKKYNQNIINNCREFCKKNFSLDLQANRYKKLYDDILKK
ncbi:methyltransferase, FkbM family [Desulfonauticus submarinus]|uniref:Methyltransferase, FkbM family n=1 Tax=Desulfonauticus submarinus TaxID=206665 RepID=A0A1H0BFM0_9BACT|nr:FkbM family methyltransferase [Desulfonauticus submarinus]SDN44385.1 methyltransferase, FkbM family [Desulfonauticus submarinus]